MEECYIKHPDMKRKLFPAFRISVRSPRKIWKSSPSKILLSRRQKEEKRKAEKKDRPKRFAKNEYPKPPSEEEIQAKREEWGDLGAYIWTLAVYKSLPTFRYWYNLSKITRCFYTPIYISPRNIRRLALKSRAKQKKSIYGFKDMFHYQKKFIF